MCNMADDLADAMSRLRRRELRIQELEDMMGQYKDMMGQYEDALKEEKEEGDAMIAHLNGQLTQLVLALLT